MFTPSDRNWKEMQYEAAGSWPLPINHGNEYALVTKMPASVIKAAYRHCPMSLTVARANTPNGIVLGTTLTVNDDPAAPLMLSGILRHGEEQVALDNILRLGRTLMVFFDELTRPVARAECVLSSPECAACSEMISMPGQRYVGAWTALLEEVLDEVQSHSDPHIAAASKHRPAFVTIPLTLSRVETAKMTAIGLNDIIDFRLDDPDEGRGFEQSTWHLLENLFGPMLYHSPQFLEGCSPRELTDIMAVASTGLCLFEAKNAAILSTRLDRTTVRRTTSVQKQIDKGVVQLSGALRTLNNGLPLQTKKGVPLILGPATGQHRHAIVMVSEMLPGVDWEAIGTQLLTAAQRSGAMFHILDLRELRVLVGISRNDPARFIAQLTHRFGVMTVRKHAMLRTRLTGPPLP